MNTHTPTTSTAPCATTPTAADLPADLQSLLLDLIRIPSVTDDIPHVNEAVATLQAYLTDHGVPCTLETLNDRHILYASTQPGKVQDYLLNAHLDVVPAPQHLFEPHITPEGNLHCRGGHDDKAAAVAIAHILCLLRNTDASVGAVFSTDEETGGLTAAAMAERGYAARKLALVLDGPYHSLAIAQKGTANFTLRAHGKGGHSSTPWEFDNALDRLLEGYAKIQAAWPQPMPSAEDHWHDTYAATILHCGTVANRIPDTAEMTLNIRYTQPDGEEFYRQWLANTSGLEVLSERPALSPPVVCDENHPEIQALRTCMQLQWPHSNIPLLRMHGATDARHFTTNNTPVAISGILGFHAHADNEYVSLPDMADTIHMLTQFLSRT